jgi:phage tail-like protein
MSGVPATFRLLDGRTGWDPRPDDGLVGLVLGDGALRLGPTPSVQGGSGGRAAALARTNDGAWWLGGRWGLLRLGPCDDAFQPWQERRRVRALAGRGRRLAVVLAGGVVEVFDTGSGRLLAEARVPRAVAVQVEADGSLVVLDRHGLRTDLDSSGLVCQSEPCGPGRPFPASPPATPPVPHGATVGADGFCLGGRGCFDWRGRPTAEVDLDAGADIVLRRGQFLSLALDSGVPGCRWHRIRVDAELPEGTDVEIAFATTDGSPLGRTPGAPQPGDWSDVPAGDPHPTDWFVVASGATDSTLSASPGRYGYLRLRLTGDGRHTPVVHQVRLDLPRATGLDRLPALYAEEPTAADFTERFLAIVDAQLEDIDEVLARRPALLDPDALPDDALGWLAGLLGTGFEAEMDVVRRRAFLRAAPELFRRRGTLSGVLQTLRIALGVTATVEELGTARPWGAVGTAHLGALRLFGRSRVRVRLGTSRLGGSRLESEGNPDHDAILFGASRVRVHVPAGTDRELVARVLRSQLPAHIVADVVSSRAGFSATVLRLGIDTVLTPPEPAVVGSGSLGRSGVVAPGRAAGADLVVGRPVALTGLGSD